MAEKKTEPVKKFTKRAEAARKRAEVQNSKRIPYVVSWQWSDDFDPNNRIHGDIVQALSVENAIAVFKRNLREEFNDDLKNLEILSVNRT